MTSLKSLIVLILLIVFFSCTSRRGEGEEIIATQSFNPEKFYKYSYDTASSFYYDYDNKRDINIPTLVYTNVKPRKENKRIPLKIFPSGTRVERADAKYFENQLKNQRIIYVTKGNQLIYRNFYRSYEYYYQDIDSTKKDITKPTNRKELEAYLKYKKADYKILNVQKNKDTDIVKIIINGNMYKITLNPFESTSALYYIPTDTAYGFSHMAYSLFR